MIKIIIGFIICLLAGFFAGTYQDDIILSLGYKPAEKDCVVPMKDAYGNAQNVIGTMVSPI